MDYPDYIIFRIILYYVLSDPGHLFQFTVCQFHNLAVGVVHPPQAQSIERDRVA